MQFMLRKKQNKKGRFIALFYLKLINAKLA